MKPSDAPITAIPIPPPGGPNPGEQLQQITGIKAEVDRENAVALLNWQAGCHDWMLANVRNRDMGLAIKPKPDPFVPQSVQVEADTDSTSGIVWIWIAQGAPQFCPDLPPVPAPPTPDHVHVGAHLWGLYWRAAPDNGYTNGQSAVSATADDGTAGEWMFIQSEFVGQGWYLKVG